MGIFLLSSLKASTSLTDSSTQVLDPAFELYSWMYSWTAVRAEYSLAVGPLESSQIEENFLAKVLYRVSVLSTLDQESSIAT